MKTCSVCGRQVKKTVVCPYQRKGLETCPDCCEKCHRSEPFPCEERHMNTSRRAAGFFTQGSPGTKGNDNKSREAAKKWAETLDLPEDQAIPCVVAFACLRYHRKSFVRKLASGTGEITTWQSLKIGVALFLWGRAQKKDPWGELYRITKFAQRWKTAEFVAKYFRKGQRIIIASGRIKVDPYTDKDGNKRTRFSVVADEVEFADSKRAPEDQPAGSLAADYMASGGFEEIDEEDGDLPF